jgi:hypothetical protein
LAPKLKEGIFGEALNLAMLGGFDPQSRRKFEDAQIPQFVKGPNPPVCPQADFALHSFCTTASF